MGPKPVLNLGKTQYFIGRWFFSKIWSVKGFLSRKGTALEGWVDRHRFAAHRAGPDAPKFIILGWPTNHILSMINFFRKIRQRLLAENKVSRYLLYAIGEIVLVVIGILIALQINNWNEERRFKEQEINALNNMLESLKEDLRSFDVSMWYCERAENSMVLLLSWMEKDLMYQDSLKYHFGNTNSLITPNINSSTFETLLSADLNLISNKELRQHIIYLFDSEKSGLAFQTNRYRVILEDASMHLYDTRFDAFWKTGENSTSADTVTIGESLHVPVLKSEMSPLDFESLKQDQKYRYFLNSLKNRHHYYMTEAIKSAQTSIRQLITEIEDELVRLEE